MGSIILVVIVSIVAFVIAAFATAAAHPKRTPSIALSLILAIIAGIVTLALQCFTQVGASKVGVVTTWGHVDGVALDSGPHLVSPFSRVHEVSIGLDVAKVTGAQAASKDLQSVHTDLTMNYRVDGTKAVSLYKMAPALDYEPNYIQPAMFEVFKSVVAQFTAEELVTKRSNVSEKIHEALRTKLGGYGLVIQDINMTNFAFSKAFDDAIEAKVTASQRAEQAERELARVKFEADQQVAKARGEAESIQIQAQAVKTNGGAEYLQLQAINKWNGQLPTYMSGSGGQLPFLNLSNK